MIFQKIVKYACRIGLNLNYKIKIHTKFVKKSSNMNVAYFSHKDGDENYELTFLLDDIVLKVKRQFNFTRKSSETIGNLMDRILTNIEKCTARKKKKKLKTEDLVEEQSQQLDIKVIQCGNIMERKKTCLEVMKSELPTQLVIMNNHFDVLVNAPWVLSLTLPVSILAGFPVYPAKFEGRFLVKKDCKFLWYSALITENTNIKTVEWTEVGQGFTYFSTTMDIGKRLKLVCIPGNEDREGPEVEALASNNVEAGPGLCPFDNRHAFTREKTTGNVFRVVSYNILADLYCDSDFSRTSLYPYCPAYALHIDYRKQLLIKEILGYNSDILCFQEVDSKVFELDLLPLLSVYGYEGVYSKKGGQVAEGLSCFFNTDRFRLIEYSTLSVADEIKTSPFFQDIWNLISSNESFASRLTDRTTVAQMVVLQSVDNANEILLVGNTHLYFHPDADHVRLMQGGIVIRWLNTCISQLQEKMTDKRISLILCGDFNSVPSCGIYKLYTTGVAPSDLEDWKSNEAEAVSGVTLTQPRLLTSACGTPEYTNYTVGFADCLDYIFHDCNIKTVQVIPLPSIEELKQNTALPSIIIPSDHIALVADLQFS